MRFGLPYAEYVCSKDALGCCRALSCNSGVVLELKSGGWISWEKEAGGVATP